MKQIDDKKIRIFLQDNLSYYKESILEQKKKLPEHYSECLKDSEAFVCGLYEVKRRTEFTRPESKLAICVFQFIDAPYPQMIFNKIEAYLQENNLLDEYQIDFIPKVIQEIRRRDF